MTHRLTLLLALPLAVALAACSNPRLTGGNPNAGPPPTPAQAIVTTAAPAEVLDTGTAIDLGQTPIRKLTGVITPEEPLVYPLNIVGGQQGAFMLSTPPDSGIRFTLTAPDGTVLAENVLEYTGPLEASGEYNLAITSTGDPNGSTFLMDVGVQLQEQPTAP